MRSAIALLLLAACAAKSPEEQLRKDLDPAVSWVATLQMTAEKWRDNSVPARFALATIGSGEKALDKTKQSVEQSKADAALRRRIRTQLDIAAGASARLRGAVENGDRKLAGVAIAQFAAVKSALEDLDP